MSDSRQEVFSPHLCPPEPAQGIEEDEQDKVSDLFK